MDTYDQAIDKYVHGVSTEDNTFCAKIKTQKYILYTCTHVHLKQKP